MPIPIRRYREVPSTKEIVKQLDELVDEFKRTLDELKKQYEEDGEEREGELFEDDQTGARIIRRKKE